MKTQAVDIICAAPSNPQHSQYSFRASGYCKAELHFYFYCTNQSGLLQSKESGAVRKEQALSVDLAPLWTGPVNPAPFKGKNHAFKSCFYLEWLKITSLVSTPDHCMLKCMISACSVCVFTGEVPTYYPKVFALSVLLGNNTMLFCECSVDV